MQQKWKVKLICGFFDGKTKNLTGKFKVKSAQCRCPAKWEEPSGIYEMYEIGDNQVWDRKEVNDVRVLPPIKKEEEEKGQGEGRG